MKTIDVSRRKFLGKSGAAALALPLAAAIPAAIEATSPKAVEAAIEEDSRQWIPNRSLTARSIGSTTVTVSGMPTDGSDASSVIQSAIDGLGPGGGTVIIPWSDTGGNMCVYMIDTTASNYVGTSHTHYYGILLQSKVRLQCEPGVVLQAMPNSKQRAYILFAHEVNNVEITNMKLVGERYTHTNSGNGTDEWCHGIQLLGVTHFTVRAVSVSCCTGDGICLGGINSTSPSDVIICDVMSTWNRRQALSITSGNSISVYDSEFSYTTGTAPMDGIDIEPEGGGSVSNVTIENCLIRGNAADGIQLNAHGTTISNVNVKNCLISDNYWHGFITQNDSSGTVNTGTLYGNAFYQNGNIGLSLTGSPTNYTVGAATSDGDYSNNFSNNNASANSFSYPHATKTNTNGYVNGDDIHLSPDALLASADNVVRWNSYHT